MGISEIYRATLPVGIEKPDFERKTSDFKSIFENEIKLSKHAETRIKSREIPWTTSLEQRIISGINSAQAKGSKEALILADDVAVIANIKSRTIVTAMDKRSLDSPIFTNIDATVLV